MNFYSPSSSSFECDCYICQAGMDCRTIPQTPFYPTMGQPLVYFAECSNKRRKKSNCFVRAFHWYTGDLQPEKRERPSNLGSFATWLDEKYEQFLMENPNTCGVKITQTSLVQACTPPCTPETQNSDLPTQHNAQRGKKRPSKTSKSPKQKKRPGRGKSEERASSDDRKKQSLEYILPPKELNRAASDGFHPTPTSSPSAQQRHVIKSQSLTSVEKDHSEDEKAKTPMKFDNPPVEKKSSRISKRKSKEFKKEVTIINKSCQCFVEVDKNDADTQYDDSESNATVATSKTSKEKTGKKSLPPGSQKGSKSSLNHRKSNVEVICQCHVDNKVNTQVESAKQPSVPPKAKVDEKVQSQVPPRLCQKKLIVDAQVHIKEPHSRPCVCPKKVDVETQEQVKEPLSRPCTCPKKVKMDAQVQIAESPARPCVCPKEIKKPHPQPCDCPVKFKMDAHVQTEESDSSCECPPEARVDAQVQIKESSFRTCECPPEVKVKDAQVQSKDLPLRPCDCPKESPHKPCECPEESAPEPCECPVEIKPCECPPVEEDTQVQCEQILFRSCECPDNKTDAEIQSEHQTPCLSAAAYRQTCLQCNCLVCHHTQSAVKYDVVCFGQSQSTQYEHTSHQSLIIKTASIHPDVNKKCSRECPSVKEIIAKCSPDHPVMTEVVRKCSRDCPAIKEGRCSRVNSTAKKCSRECSGVKEVVRKCSRDCPGVERRTYCTQGNECVGQQVSYSQTSDFAIDLEREVRTVQGFPFYLKVICADKN